MAEKKNCITIPYGAWYDETEVSLPVPTHWNVHLLEPKDALKIEDKRIQEALREPIGTSTLEEMAKGKKSVTIAVDDITRPTPTDRILPIVIEELLRCGISASNITIIIASGAHRRMSPAELRRKLGYEIVDNFEIVTHDFLGKDVTYVGWIAGGPVYLNRHFLNADLRLCLGCVLGHAETGFGGGAKMVVPGLAGRSTISHFHGALPPRPKGQIEGATGVQDRREWAEQVAEHIGLDAVLCTVINSRRELAGIYFGDIRKAHRQAARQALDIGETILPRELMHKGHIIIANSYPLDTDPIQLGKAIENARKVPGKYILAIDAASDGIFYHGMGMGSGIDPKRLTKNLYHFCQQPTSVRTWLGSLKSALRNPLLTARLCYFTINHQSYDEFLEEKRNPESIRPVSNRDATFMLYSKNFPDWGFRNRYPKGRLYRDWEELIQTLSESEQFGESPEVLVLPCSPLQFLKVR